MASIKRPQRLANKCPYCGAAIKTTINHVAGHDIEVRGCTQCGMTFLTESLTRRGIKLIKRDIRNFDPRYTPPVFEQEIPAILMDNPLGLKTICKRCGRPFENPFPDIRNPGGSHTEIVCFDWCANCNRIAASGIYRDNSIYFDKDLPFNGLSGSTWRDTETG